ARSAARGAGVAAKKKGGATMNGSALVLALVRASIEGGLLILAVAALMRLLPHIPAATRCALWWLASLRLLLGLVTPAVLPVALPSLPSAPKSAIASASVATVERASRAVFPPVARG